MSKITFFIPWLFALLLGCSEDKSETKASVEPEVEHSSLHALSESPEATLEQAQEFLDRPVDVNEKKGDLRGIPLIWVSRNSSNEEVSRLLLRSGSDVSMKDDEYGVTPLHLAAQSNTNPEVITVLLKAGADNNARHLPAFPQRPLGE